MMAKCSYCCCSEPPLTCPLLPPRALFPTPCGQVDETI